MTLFITTLHVLTCLALIAIVLLQHGKGADLGAAFGGGASQTVFGSRGAGNFLTKLTTGAAILFMVTSLTLSYFASPSTVPSTIPIARAQRTCSPGVAGFEFPRSRRDSGGRSRGPLRLRGDRATSRSEVAAASTLI